MKKFLAVLLTLAMVSSLLCGMTVFAAETVTVTVDAGYEDLWADAAWDGTYLINNTGDYKFSVTLDGTNATLGYAGIDITAPVVCIPSSFTLSDGTTYNVVTVDRRAIVKNWSNKNSDSKSTNNKIEKVIVSEGITTIAPAAFRDAAALTEVVIPSTVTGIGEYCFDKCVSLENIVVPSGVTSLSSNVFCNCTKLASVEFADDTTIATLPGTLFNNCPALKTFNIPDSVTTLPANLFVNCTALTTVKIPESVTALPANLFANCTALTTVKIPESVTTLPENLFAGCTALESLEIPASVTQIDGRFISGCYNVNVTIAEGNSSFVIKDHAIYNADGTVYIAYLPTHPDKVYTIPEAMSFGQYAFTACPTDRTVIVPESYTSFAGFVFAYATMDTLDVRANFTSIPDSFGRYGLFKKLILPTTVTSIGNYAFQSASKLTTINGSSEVYDLSFVTEYIGVNAFQQAFNQETPLGEMIINAKNVDKEALKQTNSITKFTFGENVASISSGQQFRYNQNGNLKAMVFLGKTAPSVAPNIFDNTSEFTIYYPAVSTGYDAAGYSTKTRVAIGGHIADVTTDGIDTTVTYTVVELTQSAEKTAIVALYDAQDVMIGAKVVPVNEEGVNDAQTATFAGVTGATSAKIYTWNNLSSAKPLYEAYEYVSATEEGPAE